LTRQVHAQVEINYAPQGLRVSVQVPLPSLANQPTAPFARGAGATATG